MHAGWGAGGFSVELDRTASLAVRYSFKITHNFDYGDPENDFFPAAN